MTSENEQLRAILGYAHFAYAFLAAGGAAIYAGFILVFWIGQVWSDLPELSFWENVARSDVGVPLLIVAGIVLVGFGYAWLNVVAGKHLLRNTRRGFCVGVSLANLLGVPFGTALGALTLVALATSRDPGAKDEPSPGSTSA